LLTTWLECREKANLAYKKGYSSQVVSNSLTFGSQFHACLDKCYTYMQQGIKEINYLNIAKNVQKEYKDEVCKDRTWTVEDEENQALNEGYLSILLPAYMKKYWNRDKVKNWIAIEKEFDNKLGGDPFIHFRGKFDRIAEYENGEKWIYETKTTSRIDPADFDRLSFDFQHMFYLLNDYLSTKKLANGVVRDIIQKPALRKGKDETLKHFMDRVKGDVDETYFQRIQTTVSQKEFRYWYQNEFHFLINEFHAWAVGTFPNYRNPTACMSKYGACRFIKLCGLGSDEGLFKRKKVFMELGGN
jgi:hypothetical protein